MYKYRNRREVIEIFQRLKNQKNTGALLAKLKEHHKETYEHSLRVAKLSIDIALENKLPKRVVKTIGRAAILHDYGKSHIDKEILSKKGPLDKKELEKMLKHPRLGSLELKKILSPEARRIITHHHEYKAKLERRRGIRAIMQERRRDSLIDHFTQIVAAADMYDALSFPRAYKTSFPLDKVRNIMIHEFLGKPVLIKQLSERTLRIGTLKKKRSVPDQRYLHQLN